MKKHRLRVIGVQSQQIEIDHTFFVALVVDTIRALGIVKTTRAMHLQCCATLLQIWFFEHITLCQLRKISCKRILPDLISKGYPGVFQIMGKSGHPPGQLAE